MITNKDMTTISKGMVNTMTNNKVNYSYFLEYLFY